MMNKRYLGYLFFFLLTAKSDKMQSSQSHGRLFHVHFTTQASLIFIFIFSFDLQLCIIIDCCFALTFCNIVIFTTFSIGSLVFFIVFYSIILCVLVSLLKKHTLFLLICHHRDLIHDMWMTCLQNLSMNLHLLVLLHLYVNVHLLTHLQSNLKPFSKFLMFLLLQSVPL